MPVLLNVFADWYCPNCGLTDRIANLPPSASRMHTCPKLRGLTAPLLRAGVRAKVEARDREDYVGRDRVQTDANGRPVMSVVTIRDDGQDTRVFAPIATGTAAAGFVRPRRAVSGGRRPTPIPHPRKET